MLKSSKGITLVALVITIIVLLILAGVTISIAVRTGLMDKSQNAVDRYLDAEKNETNRLDQVEIKMNELYKTYVTDREGL